LLLLLLLLLSRVLRQKLLGCWTVVVLPWPSLLLLDELRRVEHTTMHNAGVHGLCRSRLRTTRKSVQCSNDKILSHHPEGPYLSHQAVPTIMLSVPATAWIPLLLFALLVPPYPPPLTASCAGPRLR
jgi:hypothetical protein